MKTFLLLIVWCTLIIINALAQVAPIPLATLYEFAVILIILVGVALAIRLLLRLFGRHSLAAALLLISSLAIADISIGLTSGDVEGLIQAVLTANDNPRERINVIIRPDNKGDYLCNHGADPARRR